LSQLGVLDRFGRKKKEEARLSQAATPALSRTEELRRKLGVSGGADAKKRIEAKSDLVSIRAGLRDRPDSGLRCSECGNTSKELMLAFNEQRPDVRIFDKTWVGTCPECGAAFCIHHSPRVPDAVYGDPVPGCPIHGKQLLYD
jgi:hypothetical protein